MQGKAHFLVPLLSLRHRDLRDDLMIRSPMLTQFKKRGKKKALSIKKKMDDDDDDVSCPFHVPQNHNNQLPWSMFMRRTHFNVV